MSSSAAEVSLHHHAQQHATTIEEALTLAVRTTLEQRHPDPLTHIAALLHKQRATPPASLASLHGAAVEAAAHFSQEAALTAAPATATPAGQKPSSWDSSSATTAIRGPSSSSDKGAADAVPRWRFEQWLESLDLVSAVAKKLLEPLSQKESHPGAEIYFARALGRLHDWTEMYGILDASGIFELVAKVIFETAKVLDMDQEAEARQGSGAATAGFTCKFGGSRPEQESGQEEVLSLGQRTLFFDGLDSLIGPPNPNVREAMIHEHCRSRDSNVYFTANNYHTRTTSRVEWFFVFDPSDKHFLEEHRGEWPKEEDPPSKLHVQAGTADHDASEMRTPRPRRPYPLAHFEVALNRRNSQLRDVGEKPLGWDEFIGARMYTGPMFQKYNGVLRAIGALRVGRELHAISEAEIEEALTMSPHASTAGNVYTTTLHVINSACIKLGKLTQANKVYRGVSGRRLPKAMQQPDKYNVMGGVEFGFMSATLDRNVAIQYASSNAGSAILLEMQMGMIDRGADLSWLSQYPHEREILFAPLSALEVRRHYVVGPVRVFNIRLSVNMQALTIEQVISKMQRSHLQLIDLLQDNLRFAGVPTRLLAPLKQLRLKALHAEAVDFNVAQKYRDATNAALDALEAIFSEITHDKTWEFERNTAGHAEKLYSTAMLCARVGRHDKAIEILKLRARGSGDGKPSAAVLDERIVEELVKEGLPAPWPGTLATLVEQRLCNGTGERDPAFAKLVADHVLHVQRPDPFAEHAPVLVYQDGIWQKARIHRALRGEEEPEGRQFPFEGKRKEGYCVVSWKELALIKDFVLAPSVDGPAALLRGAAAMGVTELVEELLARDKTLPYQCDKHADTALILAAKENRPRVCKLLLNEGMSEHVRNMARENAYDVATHLRHMDVLRVFSPHDSDDDVGALTLAKAEDKDGPGLSEGVTLLMLASREGNLVRVKELLQQDGTSVYAQSKSGCTALTMAAEEGHTDVVSELLWHYGEPGQIDKEVGQSKKTAMALAAQAGHVEVLKLLAKKGANVHARLSKIEKGKEKDGRTVLHLACMFGHVKVVETLLMLGADINAKNYSSDTPLNLASRFGHLSVVELLLEKPTCELSEETRDVSWSSIHRACGAGHAQVAHALLSRHRLFLNHTDKRGMTPLMAAVGVDASECAVMLIDKNADITSQNKKGETAVIIAAKAGQVNCLRILLSHRDVDEEHVNHATSMNETALMAACRNGHESTARLLLNAKADFNAPLSGPDNPLMIASAAGHTPIVRMLLNHGASERKDEAIKKAEEAGYKSKEAASGGAALSSHDAMPNRFDEVINLLKTEFTSEPHAHDEQQAAKAVVAMADATKTAGETVDVGEQFDDALVTLSKFEAFYGGQIVPPRPSKSDINVKKTASGDLEVINGIVVQRGPYNSIWLRAGCVDKVPWSALWQTLQACASRAIRQQSVAAEEGKLPQAIWLAVTEHTLQSIDFVWLKKHGFKFHHYRKAGHVQTMDEAADRDKARLPETHPSLEPAEFVYYCWPTTSKQFDDMVPAYATSVEGATGVLLSPDEAHVLLVHERGSWSTPGGAVNPGEMKIDALGREAMEEVNVYFDPAFAPIYLGGYHQGAARDNRNNDNFSAFVVRLKSMEFKVDNKEIKHAAWFDVKALLRLWRDAKVTGRASEKKLEVDMNEVAPEFTTKSLNTVATNLLRWLDTYDRGLGMQCLIESKGRNKIVHIGVSK